LHVGTVHRRAERRRDPVVDLDVAERRAYLARKAVTRRTAESDTRVYVASWSARTVTYKAMSSADRLAEFYDRLAIPDDYTGRKPLPLVLNFHGLGSNAEQQAVYSELEAAITATVDYVKERTAFGTPISSFQNTKFELAACATDVDAGRAMLDRALLAHDTDELTEVDAAKLKIFCTELQARVVDRCLQLFGGYGFMREYPIARMYADARVTRIFGGTNEVLKTIIAKSLGL
jgi:hypothetical protein